MNTQPQPTFIDNLSGVIDRRDALAEELSSMEPDNMLRRAINTALDNTQGQIENLVASDDPEAAVMQYTLAAHTPILTAAQENGAIFVEFGA